MSAVTRQSISMALTVISVNIEGLTVAKASILSDMCKRECCHCLCLQETPIHQYSWNVRVASRRHIPRGCRIDYVQGLTDKSKNIYEAYKQQYSSNPFDNRTMESGNMLLGKMTEEKNMGGSHHIDKHDSQ